MYNATSLTGWQRARGAAPAWGVPVAGAATVPAAAPVSREQQLAMLKDQAAGFADALAEIQKQIEELEANDE
jgi:hypothetical protein